MLTAMFTIKRAAELTGVPEETLRAWERRYAVVTPTRSPSGYRLYDEQAIQRLRAMQSLVDAGWAPRQAAAQVATVTPPPMLADGGLDTAVEPFLDAAGNLDAAGLDRVLDDVFSRASFEVVADQWLMPVLREIGARWVAGTLRISAEHLAVQAIMRRLVAAFAAASTYIGGPRVIMGLAPGSHHEIGMLAFATAARRRGLDVLYLGADLPVADWVDAVVRQHAQALVISVPLAVDAAAVTEVIAAVEAAAPHLCVGVGGTHQDLVTAPNVHKLGHGIGVAAAALANELTTPTGVSTR